MTFEQQYAMDTAKELTLSAIEHRLISVDSDNSTEDTATEVLSFYNTIVDSLNGGN